MSRERRDSGWRALLAGVGLVLGIAAAASADPEPPNSQCDHVHVKGFVRTQDGQGVANAELDMGPPGLDAAGRATGMATGKGQLPGFVQGVPDGCDCGTPRIRTNADGSYDLKIRIGPDARCTSAVDRLTVDKSKMYWRRPGVSITPAP